MLSRAEEMMLIARCVAFDDHRAFARLVDAHAEALRRYLFNLTLGDASLCDDLAQETFLKAYSELRSFRGIARFATWLYRIAYHEYVNWLRSQREIRLPDADTPLPDAPDDSATRQADLRHDLDYALAQLSDTERSLVILFYYEDMPLRRIATVMDMPEGTVKVYLKRAKARMARTLQAPNA